MTEYRTKPLSREQLFEELVYVVRALRDLGSTECNVMFGWDSHLPIDNMWKDRTTRIEDIVNYLVQSENQGTIAIGRSDVFIQASNFEFVLCHESDIHVNGDSDLVPHCLERWTSCGYEPYGLKDKPECRR
jgi:hypothetical protein